MKFHNYYINVLKYESVDKSKRTDSRFMIFKNLITDNTSAKRQKLQHASVKGQ